LGETILTMIKRLVLFFLISISFGLSSMGQQGVCQKVQSFIPPHYEVFDSTAGDINGDGCMDLILILKSTRHYDHPLLLLEGNGAGCYFLAARNDSVILCEGCGGPCCHEPYQQMIIGKDYFSFAHYGGEMNIRWTRLIAFTFNKEMQQYVLRKDIGIFKDEENPGATRYMIYGKEVQGKLPFTQYSYNSY
jgi:hypothetical protein